MVLSRGSCQHRRSSVWAVQYILGNRENSRVGKRDDDDPRSLRVHSTYVRDGIIVLEKSEFIEGHITIDDLVMRVKRFEELGVELSEIRIYFGSENE